MLNLEEIYYEINFKEPLTESEKEIYVSHLIQFEDVLKAMKAVSDQSIDLFAENNAINDKNTITFTKNQIK